MVKFTVFYSGVDFLVPLIPEIVNIYSSSKVRTIPPSEKFCSVPSIISRSPDGNYTFLCHDPSIHLNTPDNFVRIQFTAKPDDNNDEENNDNGLSSLIINDDDELYPPMKLDFEINGNNVLIKPVIEDTDGFVYEKMNEIAIEIGRYGRPYEDVYITHPYEERTLKIYIWMNKKP